MPDLNDGYVKDVVGGSIPGSNITLTVDASTGEIQSTVVWTEAPRDTHIHLACSSRRARHGGGRLGLKPVGSAEAAWRQRGFSPSLIPDAWEKLALLPAGPPPMAPLLPTPPGTVATAWAIFGHHPWARLHHLALCEDNLETTRSVAEAATASRGVNGFGTGHM